MKKKQPIKAQLGQLELAELLNTLKKFIQEELLKTSKEDNVRIDNLRERILTLEIARACQGQETSKLERQLSCGARTGHHFAVQYVQNFDIVFCCVECALEYGKLKHKLTQKEKKLLKITLRGTK